MPNRAGIGQSTTNNSFINVSGASEGDSPSASGKDCQYVALLVHFGFGPKCQNVPMVSLASNWAESQVTTNIANVGKDADWRGKCSGVARKALSLRMGTHGGEDAEAEAAKVKTYIPGGSVAEIRDSEFHTLSDVEFVKFTLCNDGHIEGLQALLSLLEEFCAESTPPPHSSSAVRVLTEILEDTTPPSSGPEGTLYGLLHNADPGFSIGGIDWFHCFMRRLFSGDVEDRGAHPTIITPETTFSLVFSILEYGLLAFMKVASIPESGPKLHGTTAQSSGRYGCHCRDCDKLRSNGALDSEGGARRGVLPYSAGWVCHSISSGNDPSYNESFSSMGGVLLRLIQCAVDRIGKEICKYPLVGHQSSKEMGMERYLFSHCLENFLFGAGMQLKTLIPPPSMIYERNEGACINFDVKPCECVPLHSFAGQALLLFSNMLLEEVQNGSSDNALEQIFQVLESLVALVLAVEGRYRTGCIFSDKGFTANKEDHDGSFQNSAFHNSWCPHLDDEGKRPALEKSTHWYIQELVVRLRAILGEISAQKRRVPEFLLTFILKHISREESVRTVAEVFIRIGQSHLDISANFNFQEGLVSDVLRVAVSTSSRSTLLSALLSFMTDFLQDVPPVKMSGQLSELSKELDWFVNIAHGLTLAANLAASEHSSVIENGADIFLCDVSIMGKGIERVLAEGIAVAQWLLDLGRSLSETAWRELAVTRESSKTGQFFDETLENGGSFANFCKFLSWVDTMRKAVGHVVMNRKGLGVEFTSWLAKGRIFVEQLLTLLASETVPGFIKTSFISFTKQQGHHCAFPEKNYVSTGSLPADPRLRSLNCDNSLWNHGDRDPVNRAEGFNYVSDVCPDKFESLQEQVKYSRKEQQSAYPVCVETLAAVSGVLTASDGVALTTLTVETQQFTKVTLSRREHTLTDAQITDAGNAIVAPEHKRRWQIPTSAILKRLLQKTRPSKRKLDTLCISDLEKRFRSRQDKRGGKSTNIYAKMIWEHKDFEEDFLDDEDVDNVETTNSYIDLQRGQHSSKEDFDDLDDFIVSKNGRDYSVWLKRRQNMRRRSYRRNFFKQLREKREFLLLLNG